MLKIALKDEGTRIRVTVDGELTGQQAEVLEANWQSAASLRKEKTFFVDLCGVTSIDAAGKRVLGHMIDDGAELSAYGPKTAHIIETLRSVRNRNLP